MYEGGTLFIYSLGLHVFKINQIHQLNFDKY